MKMSPSDQSPCGTSERGSNMVVMSNNCLQNGANGKSLSRSQDASLTLDERLKILYPYVNEDETPLPRCWSFKDKYNFIRLSKNNLQVNYKGCGKTHKDASSVRATHPIPTACGIYYFEVSIVSKGRDGYMGIGLCAQGVNMNRLPGWDKLSYGYHGDDGHCFCSSGTGQVYGPTFTTGDVIGCGVNLVDGSCFYTKNGHHLGTAFTDLPANLYPTVGLQTPGEIVEANFGQDPFLFDVEGEMSAVKARIHRTVENFPVPGKHGDWQVLMNKLVCSYLVHHGYCSTAEAFARATDQVIEEDLTSIRNRQKIQKLILDGHVGKAIAQIEKLFPGFLQMKPNLHFMLKVRQFIEMVSGEDEADGHDDEDNGEEDEVEEEEEEGEDDESDSSDIVMTNGKEANGNNNDMEVDEPRRLSVVSNPARFDKLIHFGRSLRSMLHELEANRGIKDEQNTKMLQDAFAMLAYPDPWDSPVGWQLASSQREHVSAAVNSALLEDLGFPAKPPLEVALYHAKYLVKHMAANDLGACAYANIQDFVL